MANIRFVKSPNDNRIRSLPGTVVINDVINIAPSDKNEVVCISAPKMNIIHITTPKRSVTNKTTSDIITNKNNNEESRMMFSSANKDQRPSNGRSDCNDNMRETNANFKISRNMSLQNSYSHFPNDSNPHIFHDFTNSSSVSFSEKDQNFNVPSKPEDNDNTFEAIFKQSNEKRYTDKIDSETQLDVQDITEISDSGDISEKTAYIHDVRCESTTEQVFRAIESPSIGDKAKCPIMTFYNTYGTVSEGDLSDVLDEELEQLPEISQPGSVAVSSVNQQDKPQRQQDLKKPNSPEVQQHSAPLSSSRQQHPAPSLSSGQQHPAPSLSSRQQHPAPSLSSGQHQNRETPYPSNSGAGYKESGTSRPIHRSISDAGLVDNGKVPSFFRSINDAKFYGLDTNEPLNFDETANCLGEIEDSTITNEHRRFAQPAKIAWDSRISNHRSTNSLDKSTHKEMSAEKRRMIKFGDGRVMMARSLSRDSAINDRLKIRRCALADPENMIMRQEVREKIEREVEKRRTSMVRKISQFFNVHLNLNKEEDLI